MKKSIFFCLLLFLMSLSLPLSAQEKGDNLQEVKRISQLALSSFSNLITESNFKKYGFASTKDITVATIGEPLKTVMIRLDDLQKFEEKSDPKGLLKKTDHFLCPVEVGEETMSSITVAKIKGQLKAVKFGGSNLIQQVAKERLQSDKTEVMKNSPYFILTIPAFNFRALAFESEEELMLTPLFAQPALALPAGDMITMTQLLDVLVPAAKEHNGLPR